MMRWPHPLTSLPAAGPASTGLISPLVLSTYTVFQSRISLNNPSRAISTSLPGNSFPLRQLRHGSWTRSPLLRPVPVGALLRTRSRGWQREFPARQGFSFSSSRNFRYGGNNERGYRRFERNQRHGGPFATAQQTMYLLGRIRPIHLVIGAGVVSGFYFHNVETVEMTGRRRFNMISAENELALGRQAYRSALRSNYDQILPPDHPLTVMVDRVLRRLIPYAPIDGADWKVHVIRDDDMKNAFVIPGYE